MLLKKFKQYYQLSKFTLSFLVVFSSIMSYLLVENIKFNLLMIFYLGIGGFLITISANTLNQIIEKETDALMLRTSKRPLASGNMSNLEASIFAFLAAFFGTIILTKYFNGMTALVSLISLAIYAWVYTPSKKVNSLSVFIGAIPGALPCLIGWIAGDPISMIGGWILFLFQFFWQFPHFWAIAWLSHEDYSKAGFKLMPSTEGPTKYAAIQSIVYSLVLFPISLAPFVIKMCSWYGVIFIIIANIFMLWKSINLYKHMNKNAARGVMFASYIYLPIIFFIYYWFKIN